MRLEGCCQPFSCPPALGKHKLRWPAIWPRPSLTTWLAENLVKSALYSSLRFQQSISFMSHSSLHLLACALVAQAALSAAAYGPGKGMNWPVCLHGSQHFARSPQGFWQGFVKEGELAIYGYCQLHGLSQQDNIHKSNEAMSTNAMLEMAFANLGPRFTCVLALCSCIWTKKPRVCLQFQTRLSCSTRCRPA